MQTRTSSKFVGEPSTNPTSTIPKRRNRRRSIQRVEPFSLVETPVDLLRACPHHNFTELHQLDTFYNDLTPTDQDSLNVAAGGNLLTKTPRDALTIIENKSKVRNSRNKPVATKRSPHPASVKAVEEICVTCGGPHSYYQCLATYGNVFLEYRDNIQGYVSAAAVNYNQGNTGYRPQGVANQIRPPALVQQTQVDPSNELSNYKKMIDTNIKAMQNQINNMKNELRNEMQTSIQASISLPSNTIANSKGELKAITTRSGIVLDGPSVLMPPPFINPEEDERAYETLTDPELVEYTIKFPPPLVQKPQAPSRKSYEMPKKDPLHPNIPYPSRMYKEKQQDKDEI
ncbi:hypothetical protein Tco_1087919 [Tanacetum coccineum]